MIREVACLVLLVLAVVSAAPQFGGGGFSQANAQAGAFGGGGGFGNPGYGNQGYGNPGYGNHGFGGPSNRRFPSFGGGYRKPGGLSISVSKSVSIGRGGGAQSSASSGAFGK